MRVAICLSGLIGFTRKLGYGNAVNYKKTKFFFDKNLNHKGIKIDYFLHCWNEEYEKNLLELYEPKKALFEKPLDNKQSLPDRMFGTLSNNYSKKKVVSLKSTYEKEHNFKYEFVILTRFDVLILKPLYYEMLNNNKFYVAGPKKHHFENCKCLFCDDKNLNHHLNDFIFIGSSLDIDKFSLAYDYLNEYGLVSNHIITKKHILKIGLWDKTDYVFKCKTNLYPHIWRVLEYLGLFPKKMVPARIYDTDIPLIRWVDKSLYLKILDFVIFKSKIDFVFFQTIVRPYLKFKSIKNYFLGLI